MEDAVWHGESSNNPFIHSSLHVGVHHKESLVWLQAPGLCYTIDTETLPGHPVAALCPGNPVALDHRTVLPPPQHLLARPTLNPGSVPG